MKEKSVERVSVSAEELTRLRDLFTNDAKLKEAMDFGKTEAKMLAERLRREAAIARDKPLELLPKARKKRHYKHVRKKMRAEYRKYAVPAAKRRKAALLEGESWELVLDYWTRTKMAYRISREEWMEHVDPLVRGRVFVVNRYNTKKPISLDNIIVRSAVGCRSRRDVNTAVDEVLFDGKEFLLKEMGYIL